MKRIMVWICLSVFVFWLAEGAVAATIVKKVPHKRTVIKKPVKPPVVKPVPVPVVVVPPPVAHEILRQRGVRLLAAYGGGAAGVGLGYLLPQGRDYDVILDAAYYFGNQYSIVSAKAAADVQVGGGWYTGISAGWVNYSQTVANIPGLSGNVESGSHIDAGVFLGKEVREWRAQIGYGTALGLIGELSYKF